MNQHERLLRALKTYRNAVQACQDQDYSPLAIKERINLMNAHVLGCLIIKEVEKDEVRL
jgi:hypothetical protein